MSTTESTSHGDTNTSSRGGKNTLSDRHEAASPLPPVIQFDAAIGLTLNDGTTHFVTTAKVNEWQELYPAVEIMAELRKMKGWINENPKRRKTKQGIGRFIVNWLSREQDRKGGGGCGQGGCGYGHGAGDGWKHSEQTGPRVFVPSTGFRGW